AAGKSTRVEGPALPGLLRLSRMIANSAELLFVSLNRDLTTMVNNAHEDGRSPFPRTTCLEWIHEPQFPPARLLRRAGSLAERTGAGRRLRSADLRGRGTGMGAGRDRLRL